MQIQAIKKSIEIHAPKANVWKVLLTDRYNRIWYAPFSEGTHAETDWALGSKAIFTDDTNSGLVGKVVEHKPMEIISVEYEGVVTEGKEDYESDVAKLIKGGLETYRLSGENGTTLLDISCDMAEAYVDMMSKAWEQALQKIKELSENL